MWVHRLSNIQEEMAIGDCEACGPGVQLRFRKHRQQWACKASDGRRRAGYEREKRVMDFAHLGLTPDEYERMVEAQGGRCAICGGINANGRSLAIDHCHETGRIRGLLCHPCNAALGLMKDDPERLLRAVQYIAPPA